MRSLLTTGLVVMATVLGALAVVPTASAAPASTAIPAHTAIPATSKIAAQVFTQLNDTSCLMPGECVAVGQHYNGKAPIPVSDTWNGSKWTGVSVPAPSGASSGFFTSVSCWTTGCLAVGSYTHGSTGYGLSESFNGTKWTAGHQPATVSGASQVVLESVACPATSYCIADGYYVPSSNKNVEQAIAEVWSGGVWRAYRASPPEPYSNLDTISCPTAKYCVLGGLYLTSAGSFVLAEAYDGVHWRALNVAQPTAPNAHVQFINGVSCSSTTSCAAVGVSVNKSAHATAFAEVLSGGAWRYRIITWQTGQQSSLNAVSCTTTKFCIAVGGNGPFATLTNGKAAFAIWNGSTWQQHIAPAPPAGQGNVLFGVKCVSTTYCVLTGSQGKANTNTGVGLGGVLNGTTWTWHTTS
ncbi:MAG: hypothetical protein JWM19_2974 [Actinomycetia bacterium]|nr:hypothetical protein [Actinomycetes bacterium]